MTAESDNGEVVFQRFRRLLIRRWWIPAAAGLLFAMLSSANSKTTYQATATIGAIEGNSILETADFEPDVISHAIPLNVDAAAIAGDDLEGKVNATVGHHVNVSVATSDDPETATIVVVADTREAAASARSMYVDAISKSRLTRFGAVIDSLANQQVATRTLLESRIQELDDKLAEVPDSSNGLAFALLADRSKIAEKLVDVDRATVALDTLKAQPAEVLTVSGDPTVIALTDRKIKVVAGASFGILLGLALLYAMALLDRRVRSRRDLAATGFEMIAALPRGSTSTDIERLARLVVSLADQRGTAIIQMLPADNDLPIADLLVQTAAAIESTQTAIGVRILRSLDTDPHPLNDDGLFVVFTRYGESRSRDVERLAADLAVAGRSSGGVVLVDVPPRELAWARGNVDELPGSD